MFFRSSLDGPSTNPSMISGSYSVHGDTGQESATILPVLGCGCNSRACLCFQVIPWYQQQRIVSFCIHADYSSVFFSNMSTLYRKARVFQRMCTVWFLYGINLVSCTQITCLLLTPLYLSGCVYVTVLFIAKCRNNISEIHEDINIVYMYREG